MKGVVKAIHKHPYLSYSEQQALEGIIQRIPQMYPMINKILLYGSKAKGDFLEDSDVDILFITDYAMPRRLKSEIYDAVYKLEVEYSVVISAIFVSEEGFKAKPTAFIRQVQREGVILWLRE